MSLYFSLKATSATKNETSNQSEKMPLTKEILQEFGGLSEAASRILLQSSKDGINNLKAAAISQFMVGELNCNVTVSPIFVEHLTKVNDLSYGSY